MASRGTIGTARARGSSAGYGTGFLGSARSRGGFAGSTRGVGSLQGLFGAGGRSSLFRGGVRGGGALSIHWKNNGLNKLAAGFILAGQLRIRNNIIKALKKIGKAIKTDAKANMGASSPRKLGVRTGALRRSIIRRMFVRGNKVLRVEIGPDPTSGKPAIYGRIHELGLGVWPKRAYLQPALDKNKAMIEQNLGNVFTKVV